MHQVHQVRPSATGHTGCTGHTGQVHRVRPSATGHTGCTGHTGRSFLGHAIADRSSWSGSNPTRSHPGDLVGKYGVQASATDLEALPFGPTPPLGNPPLGHAMQYSSLRSGSKRQVDRPSSSEYQLVWPAIKGQFNSHCSTDQYTVIIHWSHRLPVTPVLVYRHRYWYPVTSGIPGTPGQTGPV